MRDVIRCAAGLPARGSGRREPKGALVIESGPTPNSVAICSPVAIDRRFGHRRWLVAANMRGPHPRVPEEWAHPKITSACRGLRIGRSSGDADVLWCG
jgi:hypothetical protein